MTVDYFLNLIWLCISVAALFATREFQPGGQKSRLSSFRFVSVMLVLAALFPYVSAIDDTLQLAQLGGSPADRSIASNRAPGGSHANQLVWLFESMGDSVVAPAPAIAPRFSFVKLAAVSDFEELGRPSPPSLGRSPPRSAPV